MASPNFGSLKSTLSQSSSARKDDALYKTIQYLLERLDKFQIAHDKDIADLKKLIK